MLTLKWQNGTNVVCPRLSHEIHQHHKGIWLLTRGNAGEVYANYPGRFVDLIDLPKVEWILRRMNICLRGSRSFIASNEQTIIKIVLRNATEHSVDFPGLRYDQGLLYADPAVALRVYDRFWNHERNCLDWKPLAWAPGRVVAVQDMPPVTVQPNQEYRLSINLKDLIDLVPTKVYQVRLEVKGYAAANPASVYIPQPARPQ